MYSRQAPAMKNKTLLSNRVFLLYIVVGKITLFVFSCVTHFYIWETGHQVGTLLAA